MLLSLRNLRTHFPTRDGLVRAVDGISMDLERGQILGLVGESGCGKSLTALSILRLVPPPGRIAADELQFEGRDLLRASEREMRAIRGARIAIILQNPMTALNPVYTVGQQLVRVIRRHRSAEHADPWRRAAEVLDLVSIPRDRLRSYPHELSGGMRQRVCIGLGVACSPALLIADEPTTALDVTIQAQILQLLRDIRRRLQTSVILITHDLGVVAELCDRVAVMYAGRIVERAEVALLFARPLHPYTRGLLDSIPKPDAEGESLEAIPGAVPNPLSFPSGCPFHPRCRLAAAACAEQEPALTEHLTGHWAACWRAGEAEVGHGEP